MNTRMVLRPAIKSWHVGSMSCEQAGYSRQVLQAHIKEFASGRKGLSSRSVAARSKPGVDLSQFALFVSTQAYLPELPSTKIKSIFTGFWSHIPSYLGLGSSWSGPAKAEQRQTKHHTGPDATGKDQEAYLESQWPVILGRFQWILGYFRVYLDPKSMQKNGPKPLKMLKRLLFDIFLGSR